MVVFFQRCQNWSSSSSSILSSCSLSNCISKLHLISFSIYIFSCNFAPLASSPTGSSHSQNSGAAPKNAGSISYICYTAFLTFSISSLNASLAFLSKTFVTRLPRIIQVTQISRMFFYCIGKGLNLQKILMALQKRDINALTLSTAQLKSSIYLSRCTGQGDRGISKASSNVIICAKVLRNKITCR